mmetsp:Transcript_49700/g.118429  ORF Transcript_49700/g.118429 Transcript_49700/m.118429 type:complete len:655 (-) Transcript_49700:63-2027(-)
MAVVADARHVPRYDINGEQHHRRPFQDKSQLFTANIEHPRWLQPAPPIKTRGELMQARKAARVPDSTYDFDGDGVVGSLDFMIGRNFDRDCDGKLSIEERRQAEKALENGFLDRFHRGYDATAPPHRLGTVQQRRGVIITSDNAAEVGNLTYPPHFNAHKFPQHATKTALDMSRLAEAKGAGAEIGERYAKELCMVHEPVPPNARSHPRTCEVANIRDRALADNQAARYNAGLMPMPAPVNPEREQREIGLEYHASPTIATRSQLMETRKENLKLQNEEQRARGNEVQVPLSVRKGQVKAAMDGFIQGSEQAMTLTKLKDQRKRDKIEYDMSNFAQPTVMPRSYPRFSDNPDVPFWAIGREEQQPPPFSAREHELARTASEPVFKVTQMPFQGHAHGATGTLGGSQASRATEEYKDWSAADKDPLKYLGSNTKKRFTAEMLDRGQGRNQPRYFDNIQPIRVSPKDLEDLDVTSSMETIRKRAIRERNATSQKNSEMPRTSALARKDTAESRQSNCGVTMHQPRGTGALSRASTQKDARPVFLEPASEEPKAIRVHPDATHRKRRTIGAPTSIGDTHVMMRSAGALEPMDGTSAEPKFFGTVKQQQSLTLKGGSGVRTGGFQHVDWPVATTASAPALSVPCPKPSSATQKPRSRS